MTGGDSGSKLEGLRTIYYDPEAFNVLPYRHRFTQSGEQVLTAYFIPAFTVVKGDAMDKRGYTNPIKGKEYYDKKRAAFSKNPRHLIVYCAEYCYNAEEAFSLEGENKFDKVLIAEQLAKIRLHKQGKPITPINLQYTFKNSIHSQDNITGITVKEDQNSKIRLLEKPIWECESIKDEDGNIIWNPPSDKINNLYVIGIDSIDIGMQDTSSTTKNPSDFCLVVKKRIYGLQEPQYVCIYKDRPNDIREAYKIAIKIACWYNAKINIEATRMNMISWARDNHYLSYFMKRPSATYPDPTKRSKNQYGSPATPSVIDHQTTLIADYVTDYCHNIWFEEMLDELSRYSDENKTKFDIIAACGMAELADEELHDVSPRIIEDVTEEFQDIGFYIDERGFKKYGIIENKNNKTHVNNSWNHYDNFTITSDPRYR